VTSKTCSRSVAYSYESIRLWCETFGTRLRAPAPPSRRPRGRHLALGRTLRDHSGAAPVPLALRRPRRRRDRHPASSPAGTATRPPGFFRRLLKRAFMPSVVHDTTRYANNRVEVSHQPTRRRERHMRRFRSAAQAQRFLAVHEVVRNLFTVGRHQLRAAQQRLVRTRAFDTWDAVVAG
jgi:putative transposase